MDFVSLPLLLVRMRLSCFFCWVEDLGPDEEFVAHRFSDIDSFPIGFRFGVGTTVRSSYCNHSLLSLKLIVIFVTFGYFSRNGFYDDHAECQVQCSKKVFDLIVQE